MKKLLILFIFILSANVYSASDFKPGMKVYVTVNILNYRSQPDVNGKLLGQLNISDEITILEKSSSMTKVGESEDYWYRFKSGKKTGWAFGAFLTSERIPDMKEVAKRLSGTYYYYELAERNNYLRILKITSGTYVERFYNSDTGITDEITGNVVFQADSILLKPLKRKVRPSMYINNPQNSEEIQAYRNAYYEFTEDPQFLKNLSRFKPEQSEIKLYVKYNSNGKIYLLESNVGIQDSEYGYEK